MTIDANKIGLSQSLIDGLREYGRAWAETEASAWADQNSASNTERPREMPAWTNGTLASVKDAVESQLDTEDEIAKFRSYRDSDDGAVVGAYEDVLSDAEITIDAAAAERWAELAEDFNAGHETRVREWKKQNTECPNCGFTLDTGIIEVTDEIGKFNFRCTECGEEWDVE